MKRVLSALLATTVMGVAAPAFAAEETAPAAPSAAPSKGETSTETKTETQGDTGEKKTEKKKVVKKHAKKKKAPAPKTESTEKTEEAPAK